MGFDSPKFRFSKQAERRDFVQLESNRHIFHKQGIGLLSTSRHLRFMCETSIDAVALSCPRVSSLALLFGNRCHLPRGTRPALCLRPRYFGTFVQIATLSHSANGSLMRRSIPTGDAAHARLSLQRYRYCCRCHSSRCRCWLRTPPHRTIASSSDVYGRLGPLSPLLSRCPLSCNPRLCPYTCYSSNGVTSISTSGQPHLDIPPPISSSASSPAASPLPR
ncbi:hypothetical protein R3P38DRAFT_804615 [Favolaschia claudopus]|uniref:Uncharacterized protein n=1 Tax=Favolaschia claudopus TaxID=2862362 RepID=A0AAV9Z2U6_9AGAR